MTPNPIKAALRRGETVRGLWIQSGSADIAEAAVRHGWRVLFVDNEHGASDLGAAVAIHRAALSAGGDVVLRVPAADPVILKHALDRGFRSIMAPMIEDAAAAKGFAQASLYPPRGRRGYAAGVVRASGFGADGGYAREGHDDLLLIAQIESLAAAAAIPGIAAVEGIDMLFLGPNDFSGTMGMLERLGAPEVLEALEKAENAILASGRWLGSIPRPGRTARELHERGVRMIADPSDIALFCAAASAALASYDF